MPNVKGQSSNEILSSNDKIQLKRKSFNIESFWHSFGIHLALACLPVGRDFDI